jgi:hypothetical protein
MAERSLVGCWQHETTKALSELIDFAHLVEIEAYSSSRYSRWTWPSPYVKHPSGSRSDSLHSAQPAHSSSVFQSLAALQDPRTWMNVCFERQSCCLRMMVANPEKKRRADCVMASSFERRTLLQGGRYWMILFKEG